MNKLTMGSIWTFAQLGGKALYTRPDHGWGGPQAQAVSGEAKAAGKLSDSVLSGHFFQFHPSVLEPDFDLPVGEVHAAADLQTALPRQVHVEQELLLQL